MKIGRYKRELSAALAYIVLLVLPFLFLMKRPTHRREAGPMH